MMPGAGLAGTAAGVRIIAEAAALAGRAAIAANVVRRGVPLVEAGDQQDAGEKNFLHAESFATINRS